MKILVTGANGQLGKELTKRLAGTDFLATDIAEMDISNQIETISVINAYKPDVVIHGGAYTNVDGAESNIELAYRINAIGTQNVAAACLESNAKLVYISTDYVFDGALGRAYNEFDRTNPQSIYGKSKYAGEVLAKQILSRLFIVRTSWLYGDGNNFVRTMVRLGNEMEEIKVVNDQFGSPTSTVDLASTILDLIKTDHYGTYHSVNNGVTSWFDFAKTIFELTGNKEVKVMPISTADLGRPAPRPAFSPLDNFMLRITTGDSNRHWKAALEEYLGRIL